MNAPGVHGTAGSTATEQALFRTELQRILSRFSPNGYTRVLPKNILTQPVKKAAPSSTGGEAMIAGAQILDHIQNLKDTTEKIQTQIEQLQERERKSETRQADIQDKLDSVVEWLRRQ